MANPSVKINNVVYADCPEVDIPRSTSGTAKFFYTGDANVSAADLLTGKVAFGSTGSVSGSMANNGATGGTISTKAGTVAIPSGFTTGGTVSLASSAVSDCVAGNILANKQILGVTGTLQLPSISQDSTTKILSIS